ncbi:hypothetical protein [Cellulomonas timonensis]|uniref:hypothetical protein n=1 Tax=Cellulomonas timonensis TaxID=1689271 RepID=UPI00082B208A|nr:hypothetical protein [Cellulomonas timonensis]
MRAQHTRRRVFGAVALTVALAASVMWSWQPSTPLDTASTAVTAGLRVGETVEMPDVGAGVAARVDRVEPLFRCPGRWWQPRGTGVLFSGPVTRVTVTVRGIPEVVGVSPRRSWAALNVLGDAYTGPTACECDESCEVEPVTTADGLRYTVVFFTGGTFSGLAFTPEPGQRFEWTL